MTNTPISELPITFVIPGIRRAGVSRGGGVVNGLPSLEGLVGELKGSVQVERRRAGGEAHRIQAQPGEDVVVLHLDQGPPLVLHPSTARDLLLAQSTKQRAVSRGSGGVTELELGPQEVEVSPQLGWNGMESAALANPGATRGGAGDLVLKVIEIVGLKGRAQELVASKLVQRMDDRVIEGVYALHPESLTPLKGRPPIQTMETAPAGGTVLVFVHGTCSTTCESGFANLWARHPQLVASLFSHYNNRVYALDHATLGKTPIDNALTLVRACPPDTRLHLITHSRGGLVAEVLARSAALPQLDQAGEDLFGEEGWQPQRDLLRELIQLMQEKRISVDRTVRVACPARGTLLASQRLDAYISVFRWALTLAGIPVVPELVDFLAGVARERTDPNTLPGLAVMAPDSPLIRWLHAATEVVPGELRVVAGDLQGDSMRSWVKTLMADTFFWTDNDLVVQTRSMYGGAPRKVGAYFVLDRGAESSHFNYFTNVTTATAIVSGLIKNNSDDWRVIGPLSYAGQSSSGNRGATWQPDDRRAPAEKPAVIVLPGILGSHLKVDTHRVWLSWSLFNGFALLDYPDSDQRVVEPDGPIGITYDNLMNFLGSSHEVIPFDYDWRKPIEQEARRLSDVVEAALDARAKTGQPVRFLAHSMGGLLARAMQIESGAIWDRMMAHQGARLLMLGTPNGGSWAPMQVLSGDDSFGNTITAVGAPFQDSLARATMARFPGFLQLQAGLLDSSKGLTSQEGWQKLADDDSDQISACSWWHQDRRQLDNVRWGVPNDLVLAQAVRFWEKLRKQRDQDLPLWRDKLVMVVGSAAYTTDGFEIKQGEFAYQEIQDSGDGRVTHASAMLPGVRTWKLDADHGNLPTKKAAFAAFKELLETGETNLLSPFQTPGVSRGMEGPAMPVHRLSRPSRQGGISLPRSNDDNPYTLLVDERTGGLVPTEPPLAIKVTNGNLKFVSHTLLVGHYTSTTLTGTEAVVDQLIGGTLADALAMGCYPERPGSHQVFLNCNFNRDNSLQPLRPEAVVVVGLGEEGKLSAAKLVFSVQIAVMAYAQQRMERPNGGDQPFHLSATLMGSGGSGIDPGESALLIAKGVREANKLLRRPDKKRPWPSVSSLDLIELYLDRASMALNALQLQVEAQQGLYTISPTVCTGGGGERRPLELGYRGTEYDYISALTGKSDGQGLGNGEITYTIDSRRARTEKRAQSTQRRLVEQLVAKASNEHCLDMGIGRTLFKLLVPLEMEPIMAGTSAMVIALDQGSAPIPWEMLDTDSGKRHGKDQRPWAIRTKLLRKLQLADFRQKPKDSRLSSQTLIIGEPLCDPLWPRLPGARQEARAVFKMLKDELGDENVIALISPEDSDVNRPDAVQVINTLMDRDWRIIHISGHGDLPDQDDPHGVVLSDGLYLGPREIQTMRVVPELVFINCCHLAASGTDQLFKPYNRTKFAASVAEQLIKIGVRCVVAAGWAVGDSASETFAEQFYDALLKGYPFIDAIAQAREAVWNHYGKQENTWAAYQCYGEPDWVLKSTETDPQSVPTASRKNDTNIVSTNSLILKLESLRNRASFQGDDNQSIHQQLLKLESNCSNEWLIQGEVARAFALAWVAAKHLDRAITWYERAIKAEDGGASLKNYADMANLKSRQALTKLDQFEDVISTQSTGSAGGDHYANMLHDSRLVIQQEAQALQQLVAIAPTMDLYSICGSAQKRLAMLERKAGDSVAEGLALAQMRDWYWKAEQFGLRDSLNGVFYPALNRMAADCVLKVAEASWSGFEPGELNSIKQILLQKIQDEPDFWSFCGLIELEIYEVLANPSLRLADRILLIKDHFVDLYGRVRDSSQWQSVNDQLQFVLIPYINSVKVKADSAETESAKSLLELIKSFATEDP